ncbi:MAG: protein kinase [Planctomycetota bacterium]
MNNRAVHPNEDELSDFVNGKLAPAESARIENHILNCQSCVTRLESLASDTLSDCVRASKTEFDRWQSTSPDQADIPEELRQHPRYEFLNKIGSGGMGDVFEGRHRSMNRSVAIKILKSHLFRNERAVARFQNEVNVAARLHHPNIVLSYDAEVNNGQGLLVMELVHGRPLSEIVKLRQLSIGEACYFAHEIAAGLSHAHAQGMIHRDVKPQNVLVNPDGAVKITDFGLAKISMEDPERDHHCLTLQGETFGTPDYISPEQIRNSSDVDQTSDIYSLGCTLYYLLTGRPPFIEPSVGEKLAGHLEKEPDSITQLRPDIPSPLANLVQAMMSKLPLNRPPNLNPVIEELHSFSQMPELAPFFSERPVLVSDSEMPNAGTTDHKIEPVNGQTDLSLQSAGHPVQSQTHSQTSVERKSARSQNRRMALWVMLVVAVGLVGGSIGIFNLLNLEQPKGRLAIVLPRTNLVEQELYRLQNAIARHQDKLEVEWISDTEGEIAFGLTRPEIETEPISIYKTLDKAEPNQYDAVLFIGSYDQKAEHPYQTIPFANDQHANRIAKRFVKKLLDHGGLAIGLCGGITVLGKAGFLDGKRAANTRFMKNSMREQSKALTWIPSKVTRDSQCVVVRDGQIVTAGNNRNVDEIFDILMSQLER